MKTLKPLFDNNREWADKIAKEQPGFFEQLSKQQNPEYLWIGCSDSRVPANEIVNLPPGEVWLEVEKDGYEAGDADFETGPQREHVKNFTLVKEEEDD